MGLYDYTIYSVIERNGRIYGDRIGWVCGEERLTHMEFLVPVNRVARGLLELGLQRGDRIGILAQNSMEFVYLYGAAAKIGAIVLPINWRLKPEEVEYCISDGAPKVLFVGSDFQKQVEPLLKKFDFMKKAFSMGAAEGDFAAFRDVMDNDGICPEMDVRFDDAFVIIHTAAVAGRPRGATLSHMGLLLANLQAMAMWSMTSEACNLGMLPLFHLAGLGTMLNVMHAGGKNVILQRFDADAACRLIQEEKVTIFVEFAPMLQNILDRNDQLKYDLSSLKVVGGLDGPDTVKRYEKETGGTFWIGFGQSETSGFVTFAPYTERLGSAGTPCPIAEVAVVDERGELVEPGTPGEIAVRGPLVFKGYWNLPGDNEYTFRGGWHHTGDMGRFDEGGYLWYTGRMPEKELIKPGGENVYPAEVEGALLEHPFVEEAAVIGVPDEKWGEAIKAVVVLTAGSTLPKEELIEFVASRIARFKKPKHVAYVTELPKKSDGSIDRPKVKKEHGAA